MTADQAFNVAMNEYPIIYSSTCLETSRLKYFDHLFNVIGNGYHDHEDFTKAHYVKNYKAAWRKSFPQKYVSNEKLFYAYSEVKKGKYFDEPVYGSNIHGLFTEKELETLENVAISFVFSEDAFLEDNEQYIFAPYPNFKEEYSLSCQLDFSLLDTSWKEAAVFYYTAMQHFFESEHVDRYSYAFPKDLKERSFKIKEFEETVKKIYQNEQEKNPVISVEEIWKIVSERYHYPYKGDNEAFLEERWQCELNRIKIFIQSMLEKLQSL